MTKFTSRVYLLPITIFISILCIARFNDPPNGNTGAPGEGICTNCHNPGNPNNYTGNISISGLPAQTMAGQQYSLTVTVQNPDQTAIRGGFQIVALDENDQNAGALSNPGPSSRISTSAGRTYHEHNPGRNFNGNPAISWTVNWTAPMVQGNETVTFYGAGIIGNGSGSNSDLTVSSQTVTNVQGTAAPLSVMIVAQNDPACFGENTGSATAEASGGVPPYDYVWTTGGSNATENNMPAGNHSVMVFDQGGGNAQASVTLVDPPQLTSSVTIIEEIDCPDGNNGILSVSASGGTPPLNYIWSNGQTGNTIQGLSAGVYSVTIEDINGCQKIDGATLGDPDPIAFTINTEDLTCFGQSDGKGQITDLSGGNPGIYNFEWSDGFMNAGLESIRNNLSQGNYSITISDAKNCERITNLDIDSPDSLSVNGTVTDVRCYNEENGRISLTISGGNSGYSTEWSDGGVGSIREGLVPGSYQVTVTDSKGCTNEKNYTISEPDSLQIIVDTLFNSQCGDSSGLIELLISGGNPPYTFSWSHGDSMQVADSLLPGEYIVVITDTLGCTARDTFEIIVEDIVGPEISIDPVFVFLDSTGIYEVNETDIKYDVMDECSDTIMVSFDLPIAQCKDITGTLTGMISATDQNGNTTEKEFLINVIDTIAPIWSLVPTDTQVAICSGKLWYAPEFDWDDNCNEVNFLQIVGPSLPDSLSVGMYTFEVVIIDSSGNMNGHRWMVQVESPNISGRIVQDDVTCYGGNDGKAEFIPDNPDLIQRVRISPADNPDSLTAGNYEFILEDSNGCQANFAFTINEPAPIIVEDTIIIPATTSMSGDGMISLTISGGTAPYAVIWYKDRPVSGNELPGDSTTISGLNAGSYYLVVSDSVLCTDTFSFTIGIKTGTYSKDKSYSLTVFPNPTTGILTIESYKLPEQLRLFDIGGREINLQNRWIDKSRLDLTGLQAGHYVLVATWTSGERQVKRINITP